MPPSDLKWLFVDLNSYFASVEQQENPALRGRPVGVVPALVDTSCCIAASYEAKAFGVKTGTLVWEAKLLCPKIRLVESRPHLYVSYHHKIVEAVDSCLPVETILSIDEMICRLSGSETITENALPLAQRIKRAIREQAGDYLRCSIGIAPNRWLSKTASEMKKPDGLTIIRLADLPQVLFPLELEDLAGIGPRMGRRLNQAGIHSVQELCDLSEIRMRVIWGSINGVRLWKWLRGEETEEVHTRRGSVGHSHVLEPEYRTMAGALSTLQKLVSKAAIRLRKMEYWASRMTLQVQFSRGTTKELKAKFEEAQDTPAFLKVLNGLWESVPSGNPFWVGVCLHGLIPADRHIQTFWEDGKREKLSTVVDGINERYGRDTLSYAVLRTVRSKAPTRIPFTWVPDLSEF
jgi:DNA polymerase-4